MDCCAFKNIKETDIKDIGMKAFRLSELYNKNLPTPSGIVLSKDLFLKHLNTILGKDGLDKLNANFQNRLDLSFYLNKTKTTLLNSTIDASTLCTIKEMLSQEGISGPYAVRSSALCEDSSDKSMAGIFESYMPLQNETELGKAIIKCWASAFSEKILMEQENDTLSLEKLAMGIIIQKYIDADFSGICFSRNPINVNDDKILVELTPGKGENIASFGSVCESIEIENNQLKTSEYLSENNLKQLVNIARKLEREFNAPQDIEWCIKDEELFIVQSRNITTGKVNQTDEGFFCDATDVPDNFNFGVAKMFHDKFIKKKRNLKLFCKEQGFLTTRWTWLRYNKDYIKSLSSEYFKEQFISPYLFIDVNYNYQGINVPIDQLYTWLLEHSDNSFRTVMIRESIPTDLAVISSLTEDGNIFVECCLGAMKGIASGMINTSKYILDRNANIIEKNIEKQDKKYIINDKLFTIDLVPNVEEKVNEIPEEYLSTIVDATLKMNSMYKDICLEWWIWNKKCFLVDTSRNNLKCFKNSDISVVSYGAAEAVEGIVIDISSLPLKNIEYLSHGFSVSVSDSDDSFNEINEIRETIDYLKKLKEQNEKIIILSDKPYLILSSFFNFIDGLLFKSGSVLCHLSILCREKKIPAYIINSPEIQINEGNRVLLNYDTVHVIINQEQC